MQRILFIFYIAAISANAVAADFIVHKSVTVAATNDEWTPSTVKVDTGDILIIVEHGTEIKVGGFLGYVNANGHANAGEGALMMKVGVSAGRKIGARGMLFVKDSGVVKLKVQDTNYRDNEGEYKVSVIKIPATMIPPAETDLAQ